MRIKNHPILKFKRGKRITIFFEGKHIKAYEGESVAAALIADGIKVLSYSKKQKRPRGFFCAIGKCSSCLMNIDSKPNTFACMTLVRDKMKIKRQ